MSPELPEALRVALQVIDVLDDLGVRYHVGGSYASSIHGIPRQTQDIDLVVALPAGLAARLVELLRASFYVDEQAVHDAVERRSSVNVIHLESGIKVDLFLQGTGPFDREEFGRARPELVQAEPERRVVVKTAEDTILRKLQWYRRGGEVSERQWSDIIGILKTQGTSLDRPYMLRWARELAVDDLLAAVLASI